MTEKHPEDMTAGELLRWAAENDKLRMRCDMCMKLYRMDSCGGHDCNDWLIDLADKIDAEIEEARIRYFLENLDTRIEKYGYPSRIERELFDEWINRCFIQRPLDEAGEPVQFGDYDIDWDYTDECRVPGAPLNATAVDCRGMLLATTFSNIIAVAKTDENGRVKRPATEALGADGLPIVEGDVVYELGRDDALTVYEVNAQYIHAKKENGAAWNNLTAEYLTHTPPDSQERIDEDAVKYHDDYWECFNVSCDHCPSKIDGKKPYERLGVISCHKAQILDLLRRQRELDKRMGGE